MGFATGAVRGRVVLACLAAVLAASSRASGASFGVPGAGDPPGYFILTGPDLGVEWGDKRHALELSIEVTGARPLEVLLYDPGLVSAHATTLDAYLMDAVGTVTYTLLDPSGGPIATRTFGSDDDTTNQSLVPFHAATVPAGVYRLRVTMDDSAGLDRDINTFGVSVPGHDLYSYHFTGGELNLSGARVTDPVLLHPWVVHSNPGDLVAGEDETGIDIITFDLDSAAGASPPSARIELPSGGERPSSRAATTSSSRCSSAA
jgi:hypothetical protein